MRSKRSHPDMKKGEEEERLCVSESAHEREQSRETMYETIEEFLMYATYEAHYHIAPVATY